MWKKFRRIRALIEVSNDPIWGKSLVHKKVNMCNVIAQQKLPRKSPTSTSLESRLFMC